MFAAGFSDTSFLLDTSYRDRVLADIAEHPCSDPQTGALIPGCEPTTGLRRAALVNDLRDFVPDVPVTLCAAHSDAIVLYLNTQRMADYLQSAGKTDVTVVDVDPGTQAPSSPDADLQAGFEEVKQGIKTYASANGMDPDATFLSLAHNMAVSFCHAATVRRFEALQ